MKKLSLKKIKIQSFTTDFSESLKTTGDIKGGLSGNCGSFFGVTCPDPDCDQDSIPWEECQWTAGHGCPSAEMSDCANCPV